VTIRVGRTHVFVSCDGPACTSEVSVNRLVVDWAERATVEAGWILTGTEWTPQGTRATTDHTAHEWCPTHAHLAPAGRGREWVNPLGVLRVPYGDVDSPVRKRAGWVDFFVNIVLSDPVPRIVSYRRVPEQDAPDTHVVDADGVPVRVTS
jgi:hypothetical protein